MQQDAHFTRRWRQSLIDDILAAALPVLYIEDVGGARDGGVTPAVGCPESVHLVKVSQRKGVVDITCLHLPSASMPGKLDSLLHSTRDQLKLRCPLVGFCCQPLIRTGGRSGSQKGTCSRSLTNGAMQVRYEGAASAKHETYLNNVS